MLLNILTFLYLVPTLQVNNVVTIPLPLPQVEVREQAVIDPRLDDEFWGAGYQTALELGLDLDEVLELGRVTAYNLLPHQTSPNPEMSSCGPSKEQQVAISQDLFFDENGHKHLCGRVATLIVIEDGEVIEVLEREVFDTMNRRYTESADVMVHPTDETLAYAWGVKQALIYID